MPARGKRLWSVSYSCNRLWYNCAGLKQFTPSWCSAADPVVPIPDGERFCFSNHTIQGDDGSRNFFPFTKPVGKDTCRLIRFTNFINLTFSKRITGWIDILCIVLFFQIWPAYFVLRKYCSVIKTKLEVKQCFCRYHSFKQPLVTYIVNIISHWPPFALVLFEHQIHIFCNHLKYQ